VGQDITIAKENMFRTLVKELLHIVQIQMVLSVIVYLVLRIFASYMSLGGLVMTIYPTMAAGYLVIFIMYCMIIFLYYYDDRMGALFTALTFFLTTLVMSIIATNFRPGFYGIAPFVGAFAGWTVAYLRLRHVEGDLDYRIFCKGELIKRVYVDEVAPTKIQGSLGGVQSEQNP
jgi:uncharacterized membrane protein